MTMTGKLKQQLIFGLLAWGLFAFLPNIAYAQAWLGATGAELELGGTTLIRLGGQAAVDKVAADAGYKSENIKAVSFQEAADMAAKGSGINNISGAANAAAARYKGSDGFFSGVWNTVSGAAQDLFRSSDEISADLEQYRNEKTNANIDKAVATAKDVQGKGSSILSGNIKSIPEKMEQLEISAKAVAVYQSSPDGQKMYLDKNMKSMNGVMKGCVPLPLKLEQSKKCILCPLFVILFNTAQTMSSASYNALAKGFKNLLLIGFALYVAFVTLKQVSSFTKQDGPKYVSDLLTMSFKILLAYLILSNVQELYTLVLEPLLNAAMEFGSSFLFRSSDSHSTSSFMTCASTEQFSDGTTIAVGYYSEGLFAKIDCFVRSVQQELAVATSIGSSLMCVAQNEASHWYGLPDMTMLFSGLIIWVFSWLVCLAFGFYLLDAVVRLGVVGGLMPFLIAAWPFKLTSKYTSTGWQMFMNTFFTFVFLGLVVSVNIELGLQAITGGEGGFDKIRDLVNNNEVKPLIEVMSIGLMGLLFLILCCIFGFKLCSESVSLASQMSGGSGGDIGSHIASLGAGAAKWGTIQTGKATKAVGHTVGQGLHFTGEATGINDKVRAGKSAIKTRAYNGLSRMGSAIGLKGASALAKTETSPRGNVAAAEQNKATTDNDARQNSKETTFKQNTETTAEQNKNANNQPAADNEAAATTATKPNTEATAEQNVNTNNQPIADNEATATAAATPTQNAEEGNVQNMDANASQQMSEGDNGAAKAAPRENRGETQSSRSHNHSKEKIASQAEKEAKNKIKATERKAKDKIEELQSIIRNLEIEKQELEKQLRASGSKHSSGESSIDYDMKKKLKKLQEEKQKLISQLEALKNQK